MRSLLLFPAYAASPDTGGGQRTFHLYEALARLGEVDMMMVVDASWPMLDVQLSAAREAFPKAGSVLALRSTDVFVPDVPTDAPRRARAVHLGRRVFQALRPRARLYEPTAAAERELAKAIERRRYDVIVGRYLQCTALSGALAQRSVPVVVDLDDLDEAVVESRAKAPATSPWRRLLFMYRARQIRPVARHLRALCRHVFTASAADAALANDPSTSVLPNVPSRPAPLTGAAVGAAERRPVILFVGSYHHKANRRGLLHFAARCWPRIAARVPGAQLRIVGSGGWEDSRIPLERHEGVTVAGQVSDLQPEYSAASICVVPVYEGSGTKIKVLEALMYGRAVVAATHSARGYDDLIGHGVVAADSDHGIVEACVDLLVDSAGRDRFAAEGQRQVEEKYTSATVFGAVREGLARAGVLPA